MRIKIEKIEKAEELLGSVDSLINFIEQMFLAHQMHDEQMFKFAHDSAAKTGFEITQKIQEIELDREKSISMLEKVPVRIGDACPTCGGCDVQCAECITEILK